MVVVVNFDYRKDVGKHLQIYFLSVIPYGGKVMGAIPPSPYGIGLILYFVPFRSVITAKGCLLSQVTVLKSTLQDVLTE